MDCRKYFFLIVIMSLSTYANEDAMEIFLKHQPALKSLSEFIQKQDLEAAKKIMSEGADINLTIEIPKDADLEKFEFKNQKNTSGNEWIDAIPNFIFNLATDKKRSTPMIFNTNILTVFIAMEDLAAIEMALRLGADPFKKTTWKQDAFEASIQLRKPQALDLILKKHPFDSLPKDRQQSLILSLPRQSKHGNFLTGYTCEMDESLLEVGLRNGINFDQPLKMENAVKTSYSTSLAQEALNDAHGALTVEWLLRRGFGKTLSKETILKQIDQFSSHCKNEPQIVDKIKNLVLSR